MPPDLESLVDREGAARNKKAPPIGGPAFYGFGLDIFFREVRLFCPPQESKRQTSIANYLGVLIYSATAFSGDTFKNDFTIPFYIFARDYWIGILGRMRYMMAS